MDWLKKNWVTALSGVVMVICGLDVSSGLSQGKAFLNLANLPSLAAILASGGWLAFIGGKTLLNRDGSVSKPSVTAEGMSDEMHKMENILTLVEGQDLTDDMVSQLSAIAAATVVGYAKRIKDSHVVPMLILLGLFALSGCNLLSGLTTGDSTDPVKPVVPPVVFTEQEYWDQLAKNVNADVFLNSDDLCYAVDCLAKTGELKDVSRIVTIRKIRIDPIDAVSKLSITDILKGK